MTQIRRLSTADSDFGTQLNALLAWDAVSDDQVQRTVAAIIADIRDRGDAALLDYTTRFDRWTPQTAADLEVPRERLEQAWGAIPAEQRRALEQAAARIRALCGAPGTGLVELYGAGRHLLGQQVSPLDRAGLYVPGGKAAYPSSVLMNAIPAKVAGVARADHGRPHPEW